MPLKVMDVVEQRFLIVQKCLEPGANVSAIGMEHKVGRSTLYEWLDGYRAGGLEGLLPKSRRPLTSPGQVAPAVEDEILRLRKEHSWGPRKIRDELRQQGREPLP